MLMSMKRGSKGPEVSNLQKKLKTMGFYGGSLDGSFGGGTESAVNSLQKAYHLSQDGHAGPKTMAAINSRRIFLDIGHGNDTWPPSKGIIQPDGTDFAEHSFNAKAFYAIKSLLEYNGFEVLFAQLPNAKDKPLRERTNWYNAQNNVLCLMSIHANAAGNASGHDVFYWHDNPGGKRLAETWNTNANSLLIKRHGQGVWASQKGHYGFHMVREPHVPSFLAEHFYYTNFNEWKKCYTQEYIDKCAKVAVKTICAYAGVSYKEPAPKPDPEPVPKPDPTPDTIYRVQVGAFTQKAGADALAKELQQKGYSTIVK